VGLAFLALGGLLWWRGRETAALVPAAVGTVLLLAGLVVPQRLGPVERGWMALAERISRVTTPLLMGAVYFLVVTPIGFVMRVFGHRPLAPRNENAGFWSPRGRGTDRSDLERQF
jgi:hypothetical protein